MRARGSLCKLGAWVSLPDSAACQGCQGIHSRLLMKILERSGLGRAEGIVATHLQLWDVRSIPFVYVSWSEILAPTPRMTRLTKITVHTSSEDPLCEAWLQEHIQTVGLTENLSSWIAQPANRQTSLGCVNTEKTR